jgi:probable phosphoglycerate mutase
MFDPEQMEYYNINPLKWHVDGCESISAVQKRIVGAVTRIAERHDGESVAVVTHGVALRALLCYINGIALNNVNEIRYCDNTAVSLIAAHNGKFTVEYMNDNSHLPTEISTFARQNWWKNKNVTDSRNLYFEPLKISKSQIERDEYIKAETAMITLSGVPYDIGNETDYAAKIAECDPNAIARVMHYGKPCGVAALRPEPYDDEDKDIGWISLFYLEPEFRKRGFAVQLLGYAVSYYRNLGRAKLQLQVSEKNNEAIKFYERYGFRELPELGFETNGIRFLGMEMTI